MRKLLSLIFLVSLTVLLNSCEDEDITETDTIYASDKDEEPDRDDRDS